MRGRSLRHTLLVTTAWRAVRSWAPRTTSWAALAYAVGAVCILTTLSVLVLQVEIGGPAGRFGVDPFTATTVVTFAASGALIAARRPTNPIGWLFLFSAAFEGIGAVSNEYLRREVLGEAEPFGGLAVVRALNAWGWVPVIVPVVAFVPMFFPDGRLPSARWWPMPLLGLVGAIAIAVAITFSPAEDGDPLGTNPLAVDAPWAGTLLVPGLALFLIATVLAAASLLVRMRRGTPIERQQLKVFFSAAVLYPAFFALGTLTGWEAFETLAAFGAVAVPIAVAIAILRYRLYDIDVLVRRTVTYAVLSVALFVSYVTVVALVQLVVSPVTAGNGLAVAISTLAVVVLFQPLRRRIQSSVDRRFYRQRYDTVRTLDTFAVRLRDEVDLDALRAELIRAVGATVQPMYASIWLKGPADTPGVVRPPAAGLPNGLVTRPSSGRPAR